MADSLPACPIPRWQLLKQQLHNVDGETFNQLSRQKEYQLIDVRTSEEFAAFHLPGAMGLDYLGPDFLEQIEQLNPEQTYLVYCRSGRRSVRACILMKSTGLNSIIHLDGGLNAWEASQKNN